MTRRSGKRPPLGLLWPQKSEQAPGCEKSLLEEGASIAFVWTRASAPAPPNTFSGRKPGPTLRSEGNR